MTNLHQSVTVDGLYESFGLRSTKNLKNNSHIALDHFSNVDQSFPSAILTASAQVCEEPLQLHGINFFDNPLITEMHKSISIIKPLFTTSITHTSSVGHTYLWECSKLRAKRYFVIFR